MQQQSFFSSLVCVLCGRHLQLRTGNSDNLYTLVLGSKIIDLVAISVEALRNRCTCRVEISEFNPLRFRTLESNHIHILL